jgi:hypothetical protein
MKTLMIVICRYPRAGGIERKEDRIASGGHFTTYRACSSDALCLFHSHALAYTRSATFASLRRLFALAHNLSPRKLDAD